MQVDESGVPADDAAILRFDRCEVDLGRRRVSVDGEAAKLGARAFDVLAVLAERRGRTVSKGELLDAVWPDVVVEENNLQVQVSALRKLIGPAAIATIPGRGYRLVAPQVLVQTHGGDRGDPVDPDDAAAGLAPADDADVGRHGNLPRQPRTLIGRDEELAHLAHMVQASSLVTVVGAGGVGKTSLALAAARATESRWRDGVWLIELAPVTDADAVPRVVAQALRLPLDDELPPEEALVQALGPMQMLLVLDNCEHLVAGVAALCEALVAHAPGVHLLATSQELLNASEEMVAPLGPLGLPAADAESQAGPDPVLPGAMVLFLERARAVDPRFALDEGNAAAVADICRRLDGLPLAIELAAARVRHLGALGLRDMLDDRFLVLTGGHRTAMPRHRTLRAALEWSCSLLDDDERLVLHRLSVFVGGFTLELAQAVAADDGMDQWAVLDALSHLVDKSLVVAEDGERPRYRLLETTRAFVQERQAEAGGVGAIVARHAQVLTEHFEATDEARFGEDGRLDEAQYMDALWPELGNLRAAMAWALDDPGRAALAVRLASAAGEMLRQVGLSQQGLTWMMALQDRLPQDLPLMVQARFWQRLANLGVNGRLPAERSLSAARRALALYQDGGQNRRLHTAQSVVAWLLNESNQVEEALAALRSVAELERPDWPAYQIAFRLNVHADILRQSGRMEEALAEWQAMTDLLRREPGELGVLSKGEANLCFALNSLRRFDQTLVLASDVLRRAAGRPFVNRSYMMTNLFVAQLRLGRVDEARAMMREAVPEWRRDSSLKSKCSELALLMARCGRLPEAGRLIGVFNAFVRGSGFLGNPLAEEASDRGLALLDEAGIDAGQVKHWLDEGEALDEDAIVKLCLKEASAARES